MCHISNNVACEHVILLNNKICMLSVRLSSSIDVLNMGHMCTSTHSSYYVLFHFCMYPLHIIHLIMQFMYNLDIDATA